MIQKRFGKRGVEMPAVRIFITPRVSREIVNYILWGLEEEGIPAELKEMEGESAAVLLAKLAADSSSLNVGIGIDKAEVVLHHRDLHHEPLFSLGAEVLNRRNLRCLGANAARLFKGNPLIFQDGSPGSEQ
ncbi:MAG: glycerol dehydratase reactivase beta/small subunit family protein [Bacteroidales bacterium]|nr:glycerol dehydratase reactivase beta/small subunit family protein [Bacteroidales bacterium]